MSLNNREKILNEFIDLIPMLRARLGITQEELANKIGVTRQTIISIENKKRPLVWSVFLSMAFLFFLDPRTRPFLVASGVIDPELSKILFGDSSTLTQATSMLEPDRPMLTQAQEMMDNLMRSTNPDKE